jgi:serine/threonine protein kinase
MAAPEPTQIGRYEVVSRLGQGGMGSLYLAKDPRIGRLVAIKLVRQEFDSPDARQRFAREAQSAGTLRHPNIVTIFDVDEHEGMPFIAMEYIDGETLAEVVKRKALLPIGKRIQWVEDLCSGLAYAHRQGVIHRDIKPANLMVDTEGTLKILDFGLARRDASKFTQSHVIIGTPNYMSPEQIRGQNIDTRSDIFAVGAVFYEIITYKEAFPGAVHQTMHKILHEEPDPMEVYVPNIDPSLSKILARAIVKDRDGRYADLSMMKNDLSEARTRIEAAALSGAAEAATAPMGRDARFNVPAPTQRVSPPGGTAGGSSPGSRTGSSHASKRYQTNRQSLQRRRSEQITALLDEARRLFEAGNLDKSRDKCDEALMFDPDHPGGLQLMDDIIAESDRQQVARIITEARTELQKGQLDRAEALVAEARQLSPDSADVQQLQEAIDTTRREIERTRQIQETMRRARARFAESSFDAAIRAAGEVLAIDPENAQAKDLQKRAHEAIEQHKTRGERDAAAQAAVAAARKKFESGDKEGAIKELQSFQGKHDLVTAFLAQLKGEKAPEPEVRTGGETAQILRGSRGASEDLPARRNFLIAGVSFAVIVIAATLYFQPWKKTSVPPSTEVASSPTPANASASVPRNEPGPVASPPLPPVTAPPVSTAENPQDTQDFTAAFELINKDDVAGAQKLAAAIRKRNPKFASLAVLTNAISARVNDIKKREDQIAEQTRIAAALEEEKKKSALAQKEAEEAKANAAPILSTLPGGGFVANSAPPTPELRGRVERPEIEKAIQQWADAFTKLDVNALSQVRNLTEAEATRWKNTFKGMASFKMNVSVMGDPVVVDNDAIVPVEETAQYTRGKGQPLLSMQTTKISYRLRKIGGQWRVIRPDQPMPQGSPQ